MHPILKNIFFSMMLIALSTGSVLGAELTIYTSWSIPPYVIGESDNGIAVDIIRAALALKGYTVKFKMTPNRRVEKVLLDGKADGAYNLSKEKIPNLFYSQVVIYYDDIAVSLESSHFVINKIEDLAGKRIVAFQNAPKFMGDKFAAMTLNNAGYSEIGNQELQLRMLYAGDRTDVIVMDRNIFLYYFNMKKNPGYPPNSFVIHSILPKVPIYAAFINSAVRDDFDEGLEAIRKSGEYKKIVDSYLSTNQQ